MADPRPIPFRVTKLPFGDCNLVKGEGRDLVVFAKVHGEERAEFLCRAANAYPALVEALTDIRRRFADLCDDDDDIMESDAELLSRAEAALSLTKPKE